MEFRGMKVAWGIVLVGVIVGVIEASVFPIIEVDYDFNGIDVGNAKAESADKCTELCTRQIGCAAFSWSDYQGGTCWFKGTRGDVVYAPGVKSSVMWPTDIPVGQIKDNTDFIGNDLTSGSAASGNLCLDLCQKTPGCRAFSWINYNNGTCWLKSKSGVEITKNGVQAASLYPDVSSLLNVDTDYSGHDIANAPASRPDDCFDICNRVAGCRAFAWSTYNGGTCWLKAAKGDQITKAGVVAGQGSKTVHEYYIEPRYHTDFNGTNLKNVSGIATSEDCPQICGDTANCVMAVWSPYHGGTCWLKSDIGQGWFLYDTWSYFIRK